MEWGIIAAIAAAVILGSAIGWSVIRRSGRRPTRSECRPGYQDVIVKKAVDVNAVKYVSGDGDYFPGEATIEKTLTDSSGEARWQIVFHDLSNDRKKKIGFADKMTIGRGGERNGNAAQYVIDGDEQVSRVHCVIRDSGKGLTVEDRSKNGTFINDRRVDRSCRLRSGDVLGVGKSRLRVIITGG